MWTLRGCQAPVLAVPFGRYVRHGLGGFFLKGINANFVMDDFGTAVKVPPPDSSWPFEAAFNIARD